MYRAPLAWKSVLVIPKNFVGAPSIAYWTTGTVQRDFIELIGKSPLCTPAAHPLESLSQRLSDRFSLGFPGQFGEGAGEFLGLLVSDVQRHEITGVDQLLHATTKGSESVSERSDPGVAEAPFTAVTRVRISLGTPFKSIG